MGIAASNWQPGSLPSVLAAWMSEILVGAAEATGKSLGHVAGVSRNRFHGNCRRSGGERFGDCDGT